MLYMKLVQLPTVLSYTLTFMYLEGEIWGKFLNQDVFVSRMCVLLSFQNLFCNKL